MEHTIEVQKYTFFVLTEGESEHPNCEHEIFVAVELDIVLFLP